MIKIRPLGYEKYHVAASRKLPEETVDINLFSFYFSSLVAWIVDVMIGALATIMDHEDKGFLFS